MTRATQTTALSALILDGDLVLARHGMDIRIPATVGEKK